MTNGAADTQRAKVVRFALAHRFDHIQIEGEHGLASRKNAPICTPCRRWSHAPETWMIGDNLEWEIVVPQRLGIYAIWMDAHGDGLPADTPCQTRPDHPFADGIAAGQAARSGVKAARSRSEPKISKTTPCTVAGRSLACVMPATPFDTSGKSPAPI